MCGIAVLHDLAGNAPDAELGERMLARIEHRGPDGTESRLTGNTWLGHTRLLIVDVEGGTQPLRDQSGERWVVCNGEIYNHLALREEFGDEYRTGSDSEVALSAARHGIDGIARLQGMFALAATHSGGAFLAARDRLGIKPLYWARRGDQIAFASEMCAFDADWRPDVEPFPPGHVWSPDAGLQRFGEIRRPGTAFSSKDEAREAIRASLTQAVQRRLMADVPVGVFLSGGLDSSVVAAIMARLAEGETVHSFAAGTAGASDLAAARTVADHLGLEHHERVYSADDVVAVLPVVVASIESYEPSLVRSAVPNYLLSELAAQHVKVVLTGEGADELFAGYDHMRDIPDSADLADHLQDSVDGLHHLNLQRCDRVTMAHGLEARVPFLDLDVIDVAERIPIDWRLPRELGQEKAILRESFEGYIPHEILWRIKEQFGDGSGTADVMGERAADFAPENWQDQRIEGLPAPRSREELGFQLMFAERLAGIQAHKVLGRFTTA